MTGHQGPRPRGRGISSLSPVSSLSPALVAGIIVILVVIAAAFFLLTGSRPAPGAANGSGAAPDPTVLPVSGQCSAGLSLCSGTCVDLKTDPDNCGACGFAAPYGEICKNGQFASPSGTTRVTTAAGSASPAGTGVSCPAGQSSCGGTCRNLQADTANCGSCGISCPAGQTCRSGLCLPPATAAVTTTAIVTITPELSCSHGQIACNNSCVDIFTNKKNCGVCGRSCGSQEICVNARCGPACTGTESLCNDVCTDLDSDNDNCGACGTDCPSLLPNAKGSQCMQGKCTLQACKTDYGDCNGKLTDGCEANLRTDAANCGACGNVCEAGQVCYSRKCSAPATG